MYVTLGRRNRCTRKEIAATISKKDSAWVGKRSEMKYIYDSSKHGWTRMAVFMQAEEFGGREI